MSGDADKSVQVIRALDLFQDVVLILAYKYEPQTIPDYFFKIAGKNRSEVRQRLWRIPCIRI